jgi:hypothetical protein
MDRVNEAIATIEGKTDLPRVCGYCFWKGIFLKKLKNAKCVLDKKRLNRLLLIECCCGRSRRLLSDEEFDRYDKVIMNMKSIYESILLRHNHRIAALLLSVNSIIQQEIPIKRACWIVVSYLRG